MDNTAELKKYINNTRKIVYSTNIDYEKSNCWWDCHPFDGDYLSIVKSYSNVNSTFYLYGVFCSWECSYSYCREHKLDHTLLSYYHKKCNNILLSIPRKFAPPRESLKMFGGTLDIDEFRNMGDNNIIRLITPPSVTIVPSVVKYDCSMVQEQINVDINNNILSSQDILKTMNEHENKKKGRVKRSKKKVQNIKLL